MNAQCAVPHAGIQVVTSERHTLVLVLGALPGPHMTAACLERISIVVQVSEDLHCMQCAKWIFLIKDNRLKREAVIATILFAHGKP